MPLAVIFSVPDDRLAGAKLMQNAHFLFAVVIVACLITMHQTVVSLVATWATSSSHTHGFFIAPLAVAMIMATGSVKTENARVPTNLQSVPTIIIILAAVMWVVGAAGNVNLIEQTGFVTMIIGATGVVYGANVYRQWGWPLTFLLLMVPFGAAFIPPLQNLTAGFVVALLPLFGVEAALDGFLITTPNTVFRVAVACAGLNYLMTSLVLASVISFFSFQKLSSRLGFIGVAIALSIVANAIRALSLVLITTWSNKTLGVGPDHALYGWLIYAAVFAVLIAISIKFGTIEPNEITFRTPTVAPGSIKAIVPLLMVLVALAAYRITIINRPINVPTLPNLGALSAPGWRIVAPPTQWQPALNHADRKFHATYASEASFVFVSIGAFTHDRRGSEVIGHDTRSFDGDIWRLTNQITSVAYFAEQSTSWPVDILTGPKRQRMSVMKFYWLDNNIYSNPTALKLEQTKQRLVGRNHPAGVIFVAAPETNRQEDTIQTIRRFTADIEPLRFWLQRNHAGAQ